MSEIIFKTENLKKQYRKKGKKEYFNALDGLNMEIRRGDIYGFVGKNGAGKTTLMRILSGRVYSDSGKMELFGECDEEEMYKVRARIGAMIEKPALYPNMTAEENLEVLRLQYGMEDRECIYELIKLVGLSDAEGKKAKEFSLGMKQRLGLAMAMLGNRELLVLDEPINGLDPEGIIEFRDILKRLNEEQGTTILISSHLLKELNMLATRYGFIRAGKMVEEISVDELKGVDMEEYYMSVMRRKL